jgi:hypothetical protein
MSAGERINVSIRIRPLSQKEKEEKEESVFTKMIPEGVNNQSALVAERGKDAGVLFDSVYTETSTNEEIFQEVGKKAVERLLEGYNGTIFMYGQTGSGKTHTMTGVPEDNGITGRVIEHIYKMIGDTSSREFLVRGAYIELYNEKIHDLLNNRKKLDLNYVGDQFHASKRTETCAKDADELDEVRKLGESSKKMGVSNLNEHSSRSHSIFSITIESTPKESPESGETGDDKDEKKESQDSSTSFVRVSTLNLVDLAGSETFASNFGESQQRETVSINKSLSSLKDVIVALAKKNQKFIPYRNSMLTKLLKSSLGGNACTTIICCITPASKHRKVTNYTLEFGKMANTITNIPKQNLTGSDDKTVLIKQYQREIQQMSSKLRRLEQLEKETDLAQKEIARLRGMAAVVVDGPSVKYEHELRINKLEDQLAKEKKRSEEAMDAAVSRDKHLAETLRQNEQDMNEALTIIRMEYENEREELLEEVANERAAMMMNSGRADLREVVEQRNEIERLQNELHIAHDRMTMMESMLAEAQSVISALGAH